MSDLKLKNLCSIKGGSGFPEEYQGKAEGEYPFAKVSDMSLPGNERYILRTNNYVDEDLVRFMHFTVFPRGSVVFAKVGAAIFLNRRRILAQETILDNNMMGLLPYGVDVDFLYHFMQSVDLGYLVQPGALPSVNQEIIGEIELPEFTATEQRKIAKILTTVDNLIEKTEALIAKYQAIKQGMMHDLFTRGVDEHGHLRPPYDEAPELYKEFELGWIPKEWEIARLGELAQVGGGVTLGRKLEGKLVAMPYLRVANVQDGFLDLSEIKMVEVLKGEVSRYLLESGDVVMTEGGDFDKLGRGTVWRGEIDPCLHQNHIFRVRPNHSLLRSDFLAILTLSSHGKKYFLVSSKQTTNLATINSTQLKAFPVLLPKPKEQDRFVDSFRSLNTKIDREKAYQEKLSKMKTGLMQDLLTGKVRVKIDESEEVLETHA